MLRLWCRVRGGLIKISLLGHVMWLCIWLWLIPDILVVRLLLELFLRRAIEVLEVLVRFSQCFILGFFDNVPHEEVQLNLGEGDQIAISVGGSRVTSGGGVGGFRVLRRFGQRAGLFHLVGSLSSGGGSHLCGLDSNLPRDLWGGAETFVGAGDHIGFDPVSFHEIGRTRCHLGKVQIHLTCAHSLQTVVFCSFGLAGRQNCNATG
jgi:hypothetical protein